ncbi:hypothetical protein [Sphingobium sp. BS19]|uniref:hypothetical protein n=1 Tax=Sphingobium sp. BS19 TaxID=3018973 RepID=UPI0022EF8FC5|nr:hypothetical protein [Sphingobium sp. BS19]GLI99159.1 hypothetical protein Sbs19_29770 [Sphingobium sp. BS19]
MNAFTSITRANPPATTRPLKFDGFSTAADIAKATLLINTYNQRIQLAREELASVRPLLNRFAHDRIERDLGSCRAIIRQIGSGFLSARVTLGNLSLHGPRIEYAITAVERAVAALDTAAASERRAAI